MTIVEFLRARYDDEWARLDELDDLQSFPMAVHWVSGRHTVTGAGPILAVEVVAGPKAFVRFYPGQPQSAPDWGWVVHEKALEVFSQDDVRRRLREVEAKRLRIDELIALPHYAWDGRTEYGCPKYTDRETWLAVFGDVPQECDCGRDAFVERMLRLDALPFVDHPDYNPDWTPA